MSKFKDMIFDLFGYIYRFLEDVKNILDDFSFTDSIIFNDFFGAIRFIVGDKIFICLYMLVLLFLGFLFYKLITFLWSTFVPFQ